MEKKKDYLLRLFFFFFFTEGVNAFLQMLLEVAPTAAAFD